MSVRAPSNEYPTHYWHKLADGRVQCDVCPRACKLQDGQQGLCFVRANRGNRVVLTTYGRSSGYCIDPIEKKPLNHFLPGTPVLSFGTAGCNLACRFCQNWDISKSRQLDTLSDQASPEKIVKAAVALGCRSVAYTYNDPIVFLEYAVDTAIACREQSVKSVAVTSGYICDKPRQDLYQQMDAVNVDLKAFTEKFYWKITGGHLQPVLDTLLFLKHETTVWFEITTLLIPGENDSAQEIENMVCWLMANLGPDVPLHFTAFHPDWKMQDKHATSATKLVMAREIAIKNGIRHVYTGNVHDKAGQSTYCHHCGDILIGRDWYQLSEWNLDAQGHCKKCGTPCVGVFEVLPGTWGARRVPVDMQGI